jgi:hypothetical protein
MISFIILVIIINNLPTYNYYTLCIQRRKNVYELQHKVKLLIFFLNQHNTPNASKRAHKLKLLNVQICCWSIGK